LKAVLNCRVLREHPGRQGEKAHNRNGRAKGSKKSETSPQRHKEAKYRASPQRHKEKEAQV
jgi:hypothetical protein